LATIALYCNEVEDSDSVKCTGVIFDLFGTLIGDPRGPQSAKTSMQMASVLSLPTDDFRQMWSKNSYAAHTGAFQSVKVLLVHICRELGVQQNNDDIELAAQIGQDYARLVMTSPRKGTIDTLSQLRQQGYKLGLLSDCGPDPPVIWPETPFAPLFDATVFSSSVGLMKPDHRIYQLVVELLGVESKDCVYVSNGQGGEVRGAYEEGMYPVVITPSPDDEFFCRSPQDDQKALAEQEGAVISSLREVLAIVSG